MPNWVENDLYVTGEKEHIDALILSISSSDRIIDFNKIIPYPKSFADKDSEYLELGFEAFRKKHGPRAQDGYNSGGYDWCCDNWGTKWNASGAVRRDYGRVCITFKTAWAPPIPLIEALHKLHPNCTLSLEYFEQGMQFCGGVQFPNEYDFCGDDGEWEAGVRSHEWESKEYRGSRGG